METYDEHRLCGLLPDGPQDVPGITSVELGTTDRCQWDAACLFGAGRLDEMATYLERAREANNESAYHLTFGMLRLSGLQAEFENVAVEYAVNVGNSPPNWLEAHTLRQQAVGKVGEVIVRSLTQETIVEVTIKMELPWPCVIDLENVTKIDPLGLELFNDCLAQRLGRGDKTKIVKADKLVRGFMETVRQGTVKQNQAKWDFCFMYLRTRGDQQPYAELADLYKKAGGMPSVWRDNSWRDERDEAAKVQGGFTAGEGLADLNAAFADRLIREGLASAAAKSRQPIRVDFTKTRAGSLLDMTSVHAFVSKLLQEKVSIQFVNVNEIHAAILRMMGVDRSVKISIAGSTS
jgi:anti-anti-sigma regulatory factor